MPRRWSAGGWRGKGIQQEWEIPAWLFENLKEKDHQENVNMGAVIWKLVLKEFDVIRVG